MKKSTVIASTFADPADIEAFNKAKARGLSDREAFKFGDNGIGVWGDDTTKPFPMCALPREEWEHLGRKARGRKIAVSTANRTIICELRDTMPAQRHITNGAGIDLNFQAAKMLGKMPPARFKVEWCWIEENETPRTNFWGKIRHWWETIRRPGNALK